MLHLQFSTLKTICYKDLKTVKVTEDTNKATCEKCKAGLAKLIQTGGN